MWAVRCRSASPAPLTNAVSTGPSRMTTNPWKDRLETTTGCLPLHAVCQRSSPPRRRVRSESLAGKQKPAWRWRMGRSQRSPAQSTESGPEYAPEFKAYMVTRCNDKEQENSRISRVDFGEPLVTLRTLGADALPAGCLPAEALPSFTGACGGGGRGGGVGRGCGDVKGAVGATRASGGCCASERMGRRE